MLSAFAAESRRLLHGARTCRLIVLPARRSAANPPAAVAAVDRWEDRRTLKSSAYSASSVKKTMTTKKKSVASRNICRAAFAIHANATRLERVILIAVSRQGVNDCLLLQVITAQFGAKPEFISSGAVHYDINQGELGMHAHVHRRRRFVFLCTAKAAPD